jgi:hypothetical protein
MPAVYATLYKYSSGIGMSVSLLAAHIAGCSSGRASTSAILTSEHYVCISIQSTTRQLEVTNIVCHISCPRIPCLKVQNTHLVNVGMKWYRDVYTELPRRLNGYILHDDIGEVFSFPRYSVPGVKGGYKVSGMAGEREESSGATRVFLWIVHDLASYQLVFPLIGLKTEENLPQKGLYRSISGRVFVFGPRDSHGN